MASFSSASMTPLWFLSYLAKNWAFGPSALAATTVEGTAQPNRPKLRAMMQTFFMEVFLVVDYYACGRPAWAINLPGGLALNFLRNNSTRAANWDSKDRRPSLIHHPILPACRPDHRHSPHICLWSSGGGQL